MATAALAALALGVFALHGSPSNPSQAASVQQQIAAAAVAAGVPVAAENGAVTLPRFATDAATLALPGGDSLSMTLPAIGVADVANETHVFDGNTVGSTVAAQPTSIGLRAAVSIESASAPERYAFPISGDVAALRRGPGGAIVAVDRQGEGLAVLAPAWARDARGRPVPTHYEIDGTSVVQVVDHRGGGYEYAITADPLWVPVFLAYVRCQTNPWCRYLLNTGQFWRAIDWARRFLF